MLELSRCRWKIKSKWHRFWSVSIWHGMAWRVMGWCIYKGVEVQGWKLWIKLQRVLCVCVRDEKSWYIEPKYTNNIYFLIIKILKYWTKWNKELIFNLLLSLMWHLRIFQFSLYRMRYLAEPHIFPYEVSTFVGLSEKFLGPTQKFSLCSSYQTTPTFIFSPIFSIHSISPLTKHTLKGHAKRSWMRELKKEWEWIWKVECWWKERREKWATD